MRRLQIARPSPPNPPLIGGCHCGAVRYRLGALPRAVNACHCLDCKRLTGAGAGVYLHVERSALTANAGASHSWRREGGSGTLISISRCAVCGTRMWHEPDVATGLVLVTAGTLDDNAWAVASSHIYAEHAAPDAVAAEDALVIEGPPADRALLWARFDELYGVARGG